jgi:hypothetical protein
MDYLGVEQPELSTHITGAQDGRVGLILPIFNRLYLLLNAQQTKIDPFIG